MTSLPSVSRADSGTALMKKFQLREAKRAGSLVAELQVLNKGLVGIAVKPVFARLGGSDHRVPGGASMFAGMLIRRAVAAQGHSALLARSQMHPACADLYALTTFET